MRALALAALAFFAAAPAQAQTGGIQVAPVMISLTPERTISSLRVRNGRDRAIAFEVDAYAWTQVDGEDVLTPTTDVLVAPGIFETQPHGDQVVRVGVRDGAAVQERAYRIILRELPRRSTQGTVLGFTLEMSLPIFVTPPGARPTLDARIDTSGDAPILRLANLGGAHTQVAGLTGADGERIAAPRYVLAGSTFDVPLPNRAASLRLATIDGAAAAPTERLIDVGRQTVAASVR